MFAFDPWYILHGEDMGLMLSKFAVQKKGYQGKQSTRKWCGKMLSMEAKQERWMKALVLGETAVEVKLRRPMSCSLIETLPGWPGPKCTANGVSSNHHLVTSGSQGLSIGTTCH